MLEDTGGNMKSKSYNAHKGIPPCHLQLGQRLAMGKSAFVVITNLNFYVVFCVLYYQFPDSILTSADQYQ